MSGSSARSCGSIATTCRLPLLGCAACALLMLFVLSAAALAQGVTGTVSGTVKDAQGGVVPGATVTLINEAQGTQLAPVTTNATGDFVVPNVAAGTVYGAGRDALLPDVEALGHRRQPGRAHRPSADDH